MTVKMMRIAWSISIMNNENKAVGFELKRMSQKYSESKSFSFTWHVFVSPVGSHVVILIEVVSLIRSGQSPYIDMDWIVPFVSW